MFQGVVGGEDQQHGVPGQTLKTASLFGEERVTEDHCIVLHVVVFRTFCRKGLSHGCCFWL